MLRAGVIGYGPAGRGLHCPLLTGAGFFIAAICSRTLEKRTVAQRDFPLAAIVSDANELVAEDLDLVVVASSNDVHIEHARLAIDAGIAVVVDKPLANDYYQTREIFDYAAARNVPLTVFFNRLWDSDTLTIQKLLLGDEIGEVIRHESRFERFRPNHDDSAWRETFSHEIGGGLLLDLQTHLIANSLALFGPAELVFASVRTIRARSDDDSVIALRHHNGVESYLSVSAVSGAPGPRVRINGTRGAFIASELDPQEQLLSAGLRPTSDGWSDPKAATGEFRIHKGKDSYSYSGVPGNAVTFYNQMREVLANGAKLPVAPEFAISVAEIIDAARAYQVGIR